MKSFLKKLNDCVFKILKIIKSKRIDYSSNEEEKETLSTSSSSSSLSSNLFDLRSFELNSSNVQLKANLYTRKFVCGSDDYNDNDENELVKEFNLDMASSSSFTSTPTTTSTSIDPSSSTLTTTHLNNLTPPVTPPPILKHAKMSPSSSRSPSSRNINIGTSRPSPSPSMTPQQQNYH